MFYHLLFFPKVFLNKVVGLFNYMPHKEKMKYCVIQSEYDGK